MEKLNLHYYDNKIVHDVSIDKEIERVGHIAFEEKAVAFSRLRDLLAAKNASCIAAYDAIINEFVKSGRGGANYDNSNNLYACDLMYLCYEIIILKNNNDPLDVLISQLMDMYTGLCNPGRTTRLYQIVSAYIN